VKTDDIHHVLDALEHSLFGFPASSLASATLLGKILIKGEDATE
jgi:hypothetical protein